MTSPDILAETLSSSQEVHEDKRNGYGYWMYTPESPVSFAEALPELRNYGGFTELPAIIDAVDKARRILLIGEPGSGKSHLVRDLQVDCAINSVPAFCLTVHINGGKKDGVQNIKPQLEEFRTKTKASGGLLILDNIDYIGYKGGSRNFGKAEAYAREFQPLIADLITDESLYILATAHDEPWREGRWAWRNELIDGPARATLEAFPSKLTFEGKMALEGLAQILLSRKPGTEADDEAVNNRIDKVSIGDATKVMLELSKLGRANFFHANHLELEKFLKDPDTAIQEIDQGRQLRRGKSVT